MKFLHFATSWVRYRWWKFLGYKSLVPERVSDARFWECVECPHANDGECLKCGCLVQAKVMLASEKCPIGRWSSIKIKN